MSIGNRFIYLLGSKDRLHVQYSLIIINNKLESNCFIVTGNTGGSVWRRKCILHPTVLYWWKIWNEVGSNINL